MLSMELNTRFLLKHRYHFGVLLLVVFILIIRFEAFLLPYFWDELGVYARAALYLHDHGISILPAGLPPELSRGHPMLFVFLASIFYTLFADTVLVAHLFSASISIAFIISVFFIFTKLYSKKIGFLTSLFIAVQPFYLSQVTLLLPEMLLALCTIWAFYFYIQNRFFLYFVFAGLAILTKETALLIPLAIFSYELIGMIKAKKVDAASIKFLAPIFIFILFISIQKIQNGWFLFPYHTDLIDFTFSNIIDKIYRLFYFYLIAQGRIVILPILIVGIWEITKKEKMIFLTKKESVFILFISYYILFVGVNFYMNRYHLLIAPFVFVFVSCFIVTIFPNVKHQLITTIVFILPIIFNINNKREFLYDSDINYKYSVQAIQQLDQYFVENNIKNVSLFCDFPINIAFSESRFGYTKNVKYKLFSKYNSRVDFIVKNHPSNNLIWVDKNKIPFKEFSRRYAKIKLYKNK